MGLRWGDGPGPQACQCQAERRQPSERASADRQPSANAPRCDAALWWAYRRRKWAGACKWHGMPCGKRGASLWQALLLSLAAARPEHGDAHVAGQEGTQPSGMGAAASARVLPPYAGRLCWLGRASRHSALCRPCMLRCRRARATAGAGLGLRALPQH